MISLKNKKKTKFNLAKINGFGLPINKGNS